MAAQPFKRLILRAVLRDVNPMVIVRRRQHPDSALYLHRLEHLVAHFLSLQDGPITVGIDGGYVRAAHKEGVFEVIAGRSVVAFRRAAEDEVPEAKCFGYVQTYDEKPRRRLWELMKSQGLHYVLIAVMWRRARIAADP